MLEAPVSWIACIREANAGAQESSKTADSSGELNELVGRDLSGGEKRVSVEEEGTPGCGRPSPGTAPERRSGKWSARRLEEPIRCSRNEGCHGGEDMGSVD